MGKKFASAVPGNVGRKFFALTENEGRPVIFELLPFPDVIRARIGETSEIVDIPGLLIRDTETRIRLVTGRIEPVDGIMKRKIKFRKIDEFMRMGAAPLTILLSIFADEKLVQEKLGKILPRLEAIFERYGL